MLEFDTQGGWALRFNVPNLHGSVVDAAGGNYGAALPFAYRHRK